MFEIKVSQELKNACPVFAGAAVYAAVKNTAFCDGLWKEINAFTEDLTTTTQMEDIKRQPVIAATREAYKRCGKDPGRYRPSAEALRRRLMRGIPLYHKTVDHHAGGGLRSADLLRDRREAQALMVKEHLEDVTAACRQFGEPRFLHGVEKKASAFFMHAGGVGENGTFFLHCGFQSRVARRSARERIPLDLSPPTEDGPTFKIIRGKPLSA